MAERRRFKQQRKKSTVDISSQSRTVDRSKTWRSIEYSGCMHVGKSSVCATSLSSSAVACVSAPDYPDVTMIAWKNAKMLGAKCHLHHQKTGEKSGIHVDDGVVAKFHPDDSSSDAGDDACTTDGKIYPWGGPECMPKTIPAITALEYANIIGTRADMLAHNAPPNVSLQGYGLIDPVRISERELARKVIPLAILRPVPHVEIKSFTRDGNFATSIDDDVDVVDVNRCRILDP